MSKWQMRGATRDTDNDRHTETDSHTPGIHQEGLNLGRKRGERHIYIYMLWSYYQGHVLGFFMVTNWATFVFLKRLFVKNTIKIGVSAGFFSKKGPEIFK